LIAHRAKPVNRSSRFWPGQSGRTQPGKNSNLLPIDLPIRSTNQSETLGIAGVPRGLPLARSLVPKTHSIKRNQKLTLKNISNPRTPKTRKSRPLTRGFGRGIKGKRTTKGSHEFPHQIPKSKVPKTHRENHQDKASKNHHQEQPGTTQQSLEEPRRIIYTYQGGSYKV
jgi:hypothetical protein